MKNNEHTFQQGAAVLLCSALLVKIIGALFKIPLSSEYCLGDLGFGYFSAAYDLFIPIYTLAISGFPVAVSKMISEYLAKGELSNLNKIFRFSRKLLALTGFITFLIMLLLIYPFVKLTDETGNTIYGLFAIAPSLIFCCTASAYRGFYEGHKNMFPTAFSNLLEALCKLILGFTLSIIVVKVTHNFALGAAAALFGIMLGSVFSYIYLAVKYRKEKPKTEYVTMQNTITSEQIVKNLIVISVPVVLSSVAGGMTSIIDSFTVRGQLSNIVPEIKDIYSQILSVNNSIADSELPTFLYGIRSKAFTLFNLVPTLTATIGISALPVISHMLVRLERENLKKSINGVIKLSVLIAVSTGIGMAFLGEPIMNLLYGSKTAALGGRLLTIYGFAAVFAGITMSLTGILQALGSQVKALRNIIIGVAVKIVLNLTLTGIVSINISSAAIGTLGCYIVIFVLHILTLVKLLNFIPDIKNCFIKPLISAVVCATFGRMLTMINDSSWITVLAIIMAVFVYFIMLALQNALNEYDIVNMPFGEKLLTICKKYKIVR